MKPFHYNYSDGYPIYFYPVALQVNANGPDRMEGIFFTFKGTSIPHTLPTISRETLLACHTRQCQTLEMRQPSLVAREGSYPSQIELSLDVHHTIIDITPEIKTRFEAEEALIREVEAAKARRKRKRETEKESYLSLTERLLNSPIVPKHLLHHSFLEDFHSVNQISSQLEKDMAVDMRPDECPIWGETFRHLSREHRFRREYPEDFGPPAYLDEMRRNMFQMDSSLLIRYPRVFGIESI